MKIQFVSLLALSCLFAACQPSGNSSGPQNPVGLEQKPTSTHDNVPVNLRPVFSTSRDESTGNLLVTITPASSDPRIESITRLNLQDGKREEFRMNSSETFLDTQSVGQDFLPWKLRYSVKTSQGQFVFEVKEYKDLRLNQMIDLSEYVDATNFIRVRQVHLGPQAVIYTQGRNIVIATESFSSEAGARIETLSERKAWQEARLWEPGQSGGQISIEAKKAQGHLKVVLRGGKGGPGGKGKDISESDPGPKGPKGANSITNPGRRGVRVADIPPELPYCAQEARDGGKGGKGKTGGDGSPGQRGGYSGDLSLIFNETEGFTYEITSIPGEPGEGGAPGKGGPGGPGGDPGDATALCRTNAKAGPRGDQGDYGVRGARGELGEFGKICLRKGDQHYCTRKQFLVGEM